MKKKESMMKKLNKVDAKMDEDDFLTIEKL